MLSFKKWVKAAKLQFAASKLVMREKPFRFIAIPLVASGVGWLTNYVGVSMLFYPVAYAGIDYRRWPEQPLGLFGWQGVVPCKRVQMASTISDITLSKLLKVSEVFERLNAATMADILSESISRVLIGGFLPIPIVKHCLEMVANQLIIKIEKLISVGDIVVEGLTKDPTTLNSFFQKVGKVELDFLINSGTYLGFLLGCVQMTAWMIYPVYWTLPVGGLVVGFITNWIALKLIFEPIHPVAVGPFTVQGLFLTRQKEVAAESSRFLSNNVLTSEEIWKEILLGSGANEFENIIRNTLPFLTNSMVNTIIGSLRSQLLLRADVDAADLSETKGLCEQITPILPTVSRTGVVPKPRLSSALEVDAEEVEGPRLPHPLHKYINRHLEIEKVLVSSLNKLTPEEFENLLHPIFKEDEPTLIAAGGALGLVAGGMQWWADVWAKNNRQGLVYLGKAFRFFLFKR